MFACEPSAPIEVPTTPTVPSSPTTPPQVVPATPFVPDVGPRCATEITPPEGWETLEIGRPPLVAVVTLGDEILAIDTRGAIASGPVDGGPWTDRDTPPLTAGVIMDVGVKDGVLWALASDVLGWTTGDGWHAVPLPFVGHAVEPLADGRVAVLSTFGVYYEGWRSDGYYGTQSLAFWDGTSFEVWKNESQKPEVEDLAQTADGRLFGVGEQQVVEWDGAAWVLVHRAKDDLAEIEAFGNEIVAVGSDGLVVRGPIDELRQEEAGEGSLLDLDIGADGTVVALEGWSGDLVWSDEGTGWFSLPLPLDGTWNDVSASPIGPVVVGDRAGPTVLWWTGAEWSPHWQEPSFWPTYWAPAVAVADDDSVWAVTSDRAGRLSDRLATWPLTFATAVAARAFEDAIVAGPLREFDGAWTEPVLGDDVWFTDVSYADDGTAFAAGKVHFAYDVYGPALFRRDPTGWVADAAVSPFLFDPFVAFDVVDGDHRFAVTESGRWLVGDATAFRHAGDIDATFDRDTPVVWARAPDDVWIGLPSGWTGLYHWNGTELAKNTVVPGEVSALAGDDERLFLVANGAVGIYRDGTWTRVATDPLCPLSVDVSPSGTAVILNLEHAWRGPLDAW